MVCIIVTSRGKFDPSTTTFLLYSHTNVAKICYFQTARVVTKVLLPEPLTYSPHNYEPEIADSFLEGATDSS